MPTIYTYVETDVDVDIEIDEFVSACSAREKQELILALIEEGHLKPTAIASSPDKLTAQEIEFREMLNLISEKYHQMDIQEINMIEDLYKKYR